MRLQLSVIGLVYILIGVLAWLAGDWWAVRAIAGMPALMGAGFALAWLSKKGGRRLWP